MVTDAMASRSRAVRLMMTETPAAEFTEAAYRDLLEIARARYTFRPFSEALAMTSGVLWRHDVDVSPHRALALARIEREAGVHATYFIYLHSTFYNALESGIVSRLREIASLGHAIGLHFDPLFHRLSPGDTASLDRRVDDERRILEQVADVAVESVSFHDPDVAGFTSVDDERIAGLINAYGRRVRHEFTYCSDSNGYWRFKALRDVLVEHGTERLHVLTHPEWWVPEPMTPRERVARAIDGRAAAAAHRYDRALDRLKRENRS